MTLRATLFQLRNPNQHVLLVPKHARFFLPRLPATYGLHFKGPQKLKNYLVQLGKGDKLSCAHPPSRAKGKLHHPFHLYLLFLVALDESLGAKDIGIWPKCVLGPQDTK